MKCGRHPALFHAQLLDLALVAAHGVDHAAHAVAQPLDDARGEADRHQLARDLLADLHVLLRAVTELGERRLELLVQPVDLGEALERVFLELQQARADRRAVVALLLFLLLVAHVALLAGRNLRRRLLLGVGIDQTVDQLVDAHLVALHPVGELEDFGDRRRQRRDRHDHLPQTVLDPLGDLDLALAREQLDRAHLPHVHPHRIGGAAELRIDGGQCRLGLFLDVLVGRGGRLVLRQDQRLGIRRLVEDLDAHVVERRDHRLDLLRVHDVGQVVVDLGVGEVAALLAELDQVLQAGAARLGVLRTLGGALHQGALGLARFGAIDLQLRDRSALDRGEQLALECRLGIAEVVAALKRRFLPHRLRRWLVGRACLRRASLAGGRRDLGKRLGGWFRRGRARLGDRLRLRGAGRLGTRRGSPLQRWLGASGRLRPAAGGQSRLGGRFRPSDRLGARRGARLRRRLALHLVARARAARRLRFLGFGHS
jgi:hypothetical protein